MSISIYRADYPQFHFESNTLEPMKDAPESRPFLSGSVYWIGKNVQGTENNYIYVNDVDLEKRHEMISAWENRRNVRLVISTVSVISAVGVTAGMLSGKLALTALAVSVYALLVIGSAIALFQAIQIEATELQAWRKDPQDEIQILRDNAFRNPEILKDWIFQIGCVEDKESILIDGFTQEHDDAYSHRYFTPSEKFWIWRHYVMDAIINGQDILDTLDNPDDSDLSPNIDQLKLCLNVVCPSDPNFAHIHLPKNIYEQTVNLRDSLNNDKTNADGVKVSTNNLFDDLTKITKFTELDFKNPKEFLTAQ